MPSKRESNSRSNQKSGSSNKKPSAGSNTGNRGRSSNTGEGLDDLTYDVITVLHQKSKGLEAFEQYIEDAEGNDEVREILEDLRDQDREAVGRLEECLRNLIGEGAESSEEEEEEGVA